jgi:hypothetical protein
MSDHIKKDARNKVGDILVLYIDKEDQQYSVSYCGLAGFGDVEFRCDSEKNAAKLFEALQNVTDVDCD